MIEPTHTRTYMCTHMQAHADWQTAAPQKVCYNFRLRAQNMLLIIFTAPHTHTHTHEQTRTHTCVYKLCLGFIICLAFTALGGVGSSEGGRGAVA